VIQKLEKLAFLFKLSQEDQWDLMSNEEKENYLTESDSKRFGYRSIQELYNMIERERLRELVYAYQITPQELMTLDPNRRKQIVLNRVRAVRLFQYNEPIEIEEKMNNGEVQIFVDGEFVASGKSLHQALTRAVGVFSA
jgi:hypothetical protein